jgi:hypothetical protein
MAEVLDLVDSSGNDLFDKILHVLLFAGAIFQIVCIFCAVFLPQQDDNHLAADEVSSATTDDAGLKRLTKDSHILSGNVRNRRHDKRKKK